MNLMVAYDLQQFTKALCPVDEGIVILEVTTLILKETTLNRIKMFFPLTEIMCVIIIATVLWQQKPTMCVFFFF